MLKHATHRWFTRVQNFVLTTAFECRSISHTGTLMAQEAKVTSLMSKDMTDIPGKERLMITVEYAPGGSTPIHRTQCTCVGLRAGGLRCGAGEGRKRSYAYTRTDLL